MLEKNDINTHKIYDEITKDGYNGSYSTLSRYVSIQVKEKRLALNNFAYAKLDKKYHYTEWVLRLMQGMLSLSEIKMHFDKYMDIDSIDKLYFYLLNNPLRYRNRSITIFSHIHKIPTKTISEILGIERQTVRSYIHLYESGGIEALFNFSRKKIKIYEEQEYRDKVFSILHSPPSSFGLIEHLCEWKTFTKPWQTTVTTCAKPILVELLRAKVIDLLKQERY